MEHICMEFEFELPVGFLGEDGTLLRNGKMRRANARDELVALADVRVRNNEAFLPILLLSRVVKLGHYEAISPDMLELFCLEDFYFLQALYSEINKLGPAMSPPASDMEPSLGNVEALPFLRNSIKR
jgi:hypothetical protein